RAAECHLGGLARNRPRIEGFWQIRQAGQGRPGGYARFEIARALSSAGQRVAFRISCVAV
ncbi:MAG: hypothetical protein KDG55_23160, partial [Rhodocyclaceae bacterium]|nr:hypothetical protein [Rhodocyclaceae bacterium]